MNRKQLVLLVAALALLGAAGWFVKNKRQRALEESGATIGHKLFEKFPLNDVARITVTNKDSGVTLAKSGEQWVVKQRADFPANFAEISEFLRKLWELKITTPVKAGASQLGLLELEAPGRGTNSGTLVEFADKDGKPLASLLLGKTYSKGGNDNSPFGGGMPSGRYLMLPGQLQTVALVSEPFSDVGPAADHWLNKEFIKVEKISSLAVTHAEATNNWRLTRTNETADWVLAEAKPGEDLDKNKTSSLNTFLSWASFNDVLEPGKSDADLGLDKPVKIAIETFDGFKYELLVGEKGGEEDRNLRFTAVADLQKERTPAAGEKPEDKDKLDKEFQENLKKLQEKLQTTQALQKWSYKLSKWTLDAGLKNRSELLAEKKPESAADTNAVTAPIEIPGVPKAE